MGLGNAGLQLSGRGSPFATGRMSAGGGAWDKLNATTRLMLGGRAGGLAEAGRRTRKVGIT